MDPSCRQKPASVTLLFPPTNWQLPRQLIADNTQLSCDSNQQIAPTTCQNSYTDSHFGLNKHVNVLTDNHNIFFKDKRSFCSAPLYKLTKMLSMGRIKLKKNTSFQLAFKFLGILKNFDCYKKWHLLFLHFLTIKLNINYAHKYPWW